MSLKQVAALLRRAGEAARRAVAELESGFGAGSRLDSEFARRAPALEHSIARRNPGPRFRSPNITPRSQQSRNYSILSPAISKTVAGSHSIRQFAYKLEYPQVRYGTMFRPRVMSMSARSILRRPFPFTLRLPTIPLHSTSCAAVDLDLTPRILLSGRTLCTETAESLCDSINGQIAHLKAVARDVQRLAQLGELSVSYANNRIRVNFDNRSSEEVNTLVRDIGLSRAIVTDVYRLSDQSVPPFDGWRFDDVSPGLSDSLSSVSSESAWTEL